MEVTFVPWPPPCGIKNNPQRRQCRVRKPSAPEPTRSGEKGAGNGWRRVANGLAWVQRVAATRLEHLPAESAALEPLEGGLAVEVFLRKNGGECAEPAGAQSAESPISRLRLGWATAPGSHTQRGVMRGDRPREGIDHGPRTSTVVISTNSTETPAAWAHCWRKPKRSKEEKETAKIIVYLRRRTCMRSCSASVTHVCVHACWQVHVARGTAHGQNLERLCESGGCSLIGWGPVPTVSQRAVPLAAALAQRTRRNDDAVMKERARTRRSR